MGIESGTGGRGAAGEGLGPPPTPPPASREHRRGCTTRLAGVGPPAHRKPEEKVEPIRIDFEGIADRVVQVPVAPGNYTALQAVAGKLHWLKVPTGG